MDKQGRWRSATRGLTRHQKGAAHDLTGRITSPGADHAATAAAAFARDPDVAAAVAAYLGGEATPAGLARAAAGDLAARSAKKPAPATQKMLARVWGEMDQDLGNPRPHQPYRVRVVQKHPNGTEYEVSGGDFATRAGADAQRALFKVGPHSGGDPVVSTRVDEVPQPPPPALKPGDPDIPEELRPALLPSDLRAARRYLAAVAQKSPALLDAERRRVGEHLARVLAGRAEVPAESRTPAADLLAEGFTGVDSHGHHWVDGKQVAKPPEKKGDDRGSAPHDFPGDAQLANPEKTKDLKPGGQVRAVQVGGTAYVIKQAENTSQTGPVEALASELAQVAGVGMPPAAMTTVGGKPALVQGFAAGKTLKALKEESPDAARAALAKVPKEEIDKNVLCDYLLGNTDVHDGNYLVSEEGKLTPIDKEMILGRGNLTGQKFEPPHLLSTARPDGAGMLHQFDPKTVKEMAAAGDKMAQALEAKGMKREARQVRDRAVVLHKLAQNPKPTAGNLHQLGSAGVTPPNLGIVGKVLWHLTKG